MMRKEIVAGLRCFFSHQYGRKGWWVSRQKKVVTVYNGFEFNFVPNSIIRKIRILEKGSILKILSQGTTKNSAGRMG